MARPRLTDPVDKGKAAALEAGEADSVDIRKTEPTLNFKPIPPSSAQVSRPFDGYPLKSIEIGEIKTKTAFIIALNPTVQVPQDPNNRRIKTKSGMVKVQTYHSRFIRDRENRQNADVQFNIPVEVDGRTYQCAIVASHNVRAQIMYSFDNQKNRIVVDNRYLLLDSEQTSRLKRVFEQVINPNIKMEKEAAFISGESKADTGETEPLPAD